MPITAIASLYQRKIVGNPWLYHVKWVALDVINDSKIQAQLRTARLRHAVAAPARAIPPTFRLVRSMALGRIDGIRRRRQSLPPN